MRILLSFVFFATFAVNAYALPITFSYTGSIGSGTLDGVAFGPTSFEFSAIGDTADRQSFLFLPGYWIEHSSASVTITGVGKFDFVTETRTFVNQGFDMVGFSRGSAAGLTDLYTRLANSAFGTWDMLTSIGPISGEFTLFQWLLSPAIDTSGGILVFDDALVPGTFQATVGEIVPVPAPATCALLGFGLAGIGYGRRKRLRTETPCGLV